MIIVRLQNGADWHKANWVFRQLAEDIRRAFPKDDAVNREIEKAQAFGGLFLDTVDKDVAPRIIRALETVAEETIQGKVEGWKRSRPTDKEGQRSYLEAISELLALLRNPENR